MPVSLIEGCFDRRSFRSIKVESSDKSRIERRQESVQSVIELIYQICVKIFSFAVDKRTKNNLYMHRVSVFMTTYSSIETFASIELIFGFNRMNSRSKQPSIELTRNGIDRLDPTDQKDNVRTESQLRVALILSERDNEFVIFPFEFDTVEDKQAGGYSSKRALYGFCFC